MHPGRQTCRHAGEHDSPERKPLRPHGGEQLKPVHVGHRRSVIASGRPSSGARRTPSGRRCRLHLEAVHLEDGRADAHESAARRPRRVCGVLLTQAPPFGVFLAAGQVQSMDGGQESGSPRVVLSSVNVGWVERSVTHRNRPLSVGYAPLTHPTAIAIGPHSRGFAELGRSGNGSLRLCRGAPSFSAFGFSAPPGRVVSVLSRITRNSALELGAREAAGRGLWDARRACGNSARFVTRVPAASRTPCRSRSLLGRRGYPGRPPTNNQAIRSLAEPVCADEPAIDLAGATRGRERIPGRPPPAREPRRVRRLVVGPGPAGGPNRSGMAQARL